MQILATIKEHPALTVAGIVGILVIVYVINHSGGGATGSTLSSGSSVGSATDYQQAQLAASAQANQIQGAITASANHDAAAIQLATIAAQQSGAHDQIAGQVATSQINATQQVQALLGSLSADVAKNSSNNDVAKTAISVNGQTQMQQILANALVAQSTNQANIAVAGITANRDTAIAGYGAQVNIADINAGAQTAIAGYNSGAQIAIAQSNADVYKTVGGYQLQGQISHDEHTGGLFGGGGFLGLGI